MSRHLRLHPKYRADTKAGQSGRKERLISRVAGPPARRRSPVAAQPFDASAMSIRRSGCAGHSPSTRHPRDPQPAADTHPPDRSSRRNQTNMTAFTTRWRPRRRCCLASRRGPCAKSLFCGIGLDKIATIGKTSQTTAAPSWHAADVTLIHGICGDGEWDVLGSFARQHPVPRQRRKAVLGLGRCEGCGAWGSL